VLASEGGLTIRRLRNEPDDLARITRWRSMPHVHEWWDPDEPPPTFEDVVQRYGARTHPSSTTVACMIELGERPVGYLQFYRWSDHTDPNDPGAMDVPLDDDPWGLDLFVGEPDLVGVGVGARAVALACRHLAADRAVSTVMLTTEIGNERAQRAYENAGFRKVRHILDTDTRVGDRVWCWLMRWDAPTG
jgi:aminoglycoside 6'-N-acetyltransferase